jgi:hypothetical protein
MRGGGSWLPLLGLMIAFVIVLLSIEHFMPLVKLKYHHWRNRRRHDLIMPGEGEPE